MKRLLFAFAVTFILAVAAVAETTVKIDAAQTGSPMSPYIYGQFIEHLGRCINGGGIWAEMLEDRKFFYAPEDKDSPWRLGVLKGSFEMDTENPFVGKHTPKFTLKKDEPASLTQWGLQLKPDTKYVGYVWFKCSEGPESTDIGLTVSRISVSRSFFSFSPSPKTVPIKVGDYYKHEFEFTLDAKNFYEIEKDASFALNINLKGSGTVHIGCVSLMPADNVHGMRADTLELLKRLNSPVYRWPGGNFVSGYDWKDGIGDRDKRPPRKNPAWKGVEPNDFGLDELMQFCNILNTEPYIAVNTGDGGVKSAVEELEYANGTADTPMGKLRKANGHAEPYGVIWWGIGNEMYGNWQIGHMPVEKYVEKNNEFVDAFRKADPKVKCIAVGHVGKWDEAFLPGAANHMDLFSEHFYCSEKKESVADHVRAIPKSIKNIADAHRKYRETLPGFKDRKPPVPIALDEWNYWYGDHVFGELGTRYFQKDGLGIAAGFHYFARLSYIFLLANYAQTLNLIGCIKTSKTAAQM